MIDYESMFLFGKIILENWVHDKKLEVNSGFISRKGAKMTQSWVYHLGCGKECFVCLKMIKNHNIHLFVEFNA